MRTRSMAAFMYLGFVVSSAPVGHNLRNVLLRWLILTKLESTAVGGAMEPPIRVDTKGFTIVLFEFYRFVDGL